MIPPVRALAVLLCASLFAAGCSGEVAPPPRAAASAAPAAPGPQPAKPVETGGDAQDDHGPPRWVYWTIAGAAAVAALVAVFVFVVVPSAAHNAARAAGSRSS